MTNFDLLKLDISKCKTPEEMNEVMEYWRYEKFPCEMNEKCIVSYSCKQCYHEFLNKEI